MDPPICLEGSFLTNVSGIAPLAASKGHPRSLRGVFEGAGRLAGWGLMIGSFLMNASGLHPQGLPEDLIGVHFKRMFRAMHLFSVLHLQNVQKHIVFLMSACD